MNPSQKNISPTLITQQLQSKEKALITKAQVQLFRKEQEKLHGPERNF